MPPSRALEGAVDAARAAGRLIRRNWRLEKEVDADRRHDIKLALDVQCQELIQNRLAKLSRHVAVLGEEGSSGDASADARWVIDPIDGTVNFAYEIPHACVSIALQRRADSGPGSRWSRAAGFETVAGAVYDPFCDELWTALRGEPARLNGSKIRVSERRKMREAIVSIGFSKDAKTLRRTLPALSRIIPRVRKFRMMGAAALALVYVASGRFDAYIERGIRLWDIAAGGLILESAGGEFWRRETKGFHRYKMIATNGLLRPGLARLMEWTDK